MTGVKYIGVAPVFIFTKFINQFRKLKSRDSQIKFIRKQASSVIVGAGTKHKLLGNPKLITLYDAICSRAPRALMLWETRF